MASFGYTARGFGNGRNKLPTRPTTSPVAATKKKKKKVSGNSGGTKTTSILTRKGTNVFNINNLKRKQGTKGRVRWNTSVKEKPFRMPQVSSLIENVYNGEQDKINTTTACDKIVECVKKAKGEDISELDAAEAIKAYLKKRQAAFATKNKVSVGDLTLVKKDHKWIIDAVISGFDKCYPTPVAAVKEVEENNPALNSLPKVTALPIQQTMFTGFGHVSNEGGGASKSNSSQTGGRHRRRKTRKRKRKKTKKRRRRRRKRTRKR